MSQFYIYAKMTNWSDYVIILIDYSNKIGAIMD